MKKSRIFFWLFIAVMTILFLFYYFGRPIWVPIKHDLLGRQSVQSVIEKIGPYHESQLKQIFEKQNIAYPPKNLTMIAIKDENKLEIWTEENNKPKLIKIYNILAASGVKGPKLREGDRQVPEGIYRLSGFNPNSAYHLSIKINYPNAFDLKYAKIEGRADAPGSNIFIHGKALSIGCLAMGDYAIEEIFTLSQKVGLKNIKIIISPSDPRKKMLKNETDRLWINDLYQNITDSIKPFNM